MRIWSRRTSCWSIRWISRSEWRSSISDPPAIAARPSPTPTYRVDTTGEKSYHLNLTHIPFYFMDTSFGMSWFEIAYILPQSHSFSLKNHEIMKPIKRDLFMMVYLWTNFKTILLQSARDHSGSSLPRGDRHVVAWLRDRRALPRMASIPRK